MIENNCSLNASMCFKLMGNGFHSWMICSISVQIFEWVCSFDFDNNNGSSLAIKNCKVRDRWEEKEMREMFFSSATELFLCELNNIMYEVSHSYGLGSNWFMGNFLGMVFGCFEGMTFG